MRVIVENLFIKKIQIIVASATFMLFVLIALDVVFGGALVWFDTQLNEWSLSWHTPLLDLILFNLTRMGSLWAMLSLSFLVSLILLWQRDRLGLIFFWVVMLGSGALFSLLKEIFERARPSSYIGEFFQHGYSFPSGHATMSMTLAWVLFYLFYHQLSGAYRTLLLSFILIFPMTIGFSRIYLGVHYFSDVSAGLVLGIFWTTSMVLLFRRDQ